MGCLSSLCLAAALATARATPRAVVTFAAPVANRSLALPANVTEVKRYGRRLVVQLGRDIGGNDTEWLAEALGDGVVGVEPDGIVSTGGRAAEVFAADNSTWNTSVPLWNLLDSEPYSIHVDDGVWRRTNSTPDVVVAVLDSGIAAKGESLFLNLMEGYDFISDPDLALDGDGRDPDSTDPGDAAPPQCSGEPSWHGTKVASILAARHDEGVLKGVAANCSVLPVRILGACGQGYANDVADAIVWAVGGAINGVAPNPHPARIISMSFAGTGACPTFLQSAITQATALGARILAAAGNRGMPTVADTFPANCNNVTSVGASTRRGAVAPYSNRGFAVAAPGGDDKDPIVVWGAVMTGTSAAVPHVAGLLALGVAVDAVLLESTSNASSSLLVARQAACVSGMYDSGGTCRVGCAAGTYPSASYPTATSTSAAYSTNCPPPQFVCYLHVFFVDGENYIGVMWHYCCDHAMGGHSTHYIKSAWPNDGWGGAGTVVVCTAEPCGMGGCGGGCFSTSLPRPPAEMISGSMGFALRDSMSTDVSVIKDPWSHSTTGLQKCPMGQVITGFYGNYGGNILGVMYINCNYICSCNAGTYHYESTCLPCAAGTYSGGGAMSCTSCSVGTYSNGGAAYGCTACGEGLISGGGAASCTACGAGQAGDAAHSACVDCPAGWASTPPTWPACYQCTAGRYSTRTLCRDCAAGQWSAAGASACTNCDAGSYSGWEGWIRCNACGAGWSSAAGSSACTQCVAGTSSASGGLCSNCAAGQASNAGGACYDCSAGSYSGAAGAAACVVCGQGTYSAAAGAAACLPCAPGSASHGGSSACGACYPGTYSGSAGAAACADCVAGKYTGSYGMSACLDCGVGTYSGVWASVCTQCGANRYAAQKGLAACLNCAAGRYSGLGWSACQQCAAGTTSVGGQPCAACGAGQSSQSGDVACSNCAAGTSSASGAACLPCAIGRYSTAGGLCQDCAPGTTATAPGTAACAPCGVGTRTVSTTACGNCSAGHFGWAPGLGACAECAPGTFAGMEVG